MKTINITFSEENIENLHYVLFIYECACLIDEHMAMYEAIRKLRKYIDAEANVGLE